MAVAVDLHQRLLLRGAPGDPLGVHNAVGSRNAPGLRHATGRGAERLAQPRRRDLAIQKLLWSSPSHRDRRGDREPDPDCAQRHRRMTFGQRGRSKPVTGEALGAWRVAWGRAAVSA
jgi:hypothetical protein